MAMGGGSFRFDACSAIDGLGRSSAPLLSSVRTRYRDLPEEKGLLTLSMSCVKQMPGLGLGIPDGEPHYSYSAVPGVAFIWWHILRES